MNQVQKSSMILGAALLLSFLLFNNEEVETQSIQTTEPSYYLPSQEDIEEYVENNYRKETNCHPSYSGCLNPDASDYDCAGGSGNGPYYTGTVRVHGYDEYGLDRDGNGWGCE